MDIGEWMRQQEIDLWREIENWIATGEHKMRNDEITEIIYMQPMAEHPFTAKQAYEMLVSLTPDQMADALRVEVSSPSVTLKEVYDALQEEVRISRDKVAQLVRIRDKYQWIVKA